MNAQGERLVVHHIFEKRLLTYAEESSKQGLRAIFSSQGEIPGVLLTDAEHQVITNLWRDTIGQVGTALGEGIVGEGVPTLEMILEAGQTVYAGNPLIFREFLLAFLL